LTAIRARENVEAALVPAGVGSAERRARAAKALEEVGPAEWAQHLPSELSGGQQVGIARALVKEPRVLLADEPTGNLDVDTRDDIICLLDKLWRERGLTLVLVIHDGDVSRRPQRAGALIHGELAISKDRTRPAPA